MKTCNKCLTEKPIDEFHKKSAKRSHIGDGHVATCKACIRAYQSSPERRAKDNAARRERRLNLTDEQKLIVKERRKRYMSTPEAKEKHRERNRRYRQTAKGKRVCKENSARFRRTQAFKEAVERYRHKNPERRSAQIAVMNALRSGGLQRPDRCETCGKEGRVEGHHHDYSKPLDVTWVCKSCHTAIHWS